MRRYLLLPLLETTVLAFGLAAPIQDTSRVSTRDATHALVIGISHYRDGTTIEYAERSGAAFRDMLERLGLPTGNIKCLFGPAATRDNIRDAFLSFSQAGPNDNIVVYFAGRSFTSADSVNPDGGIVANEEAPVLPDSPPSSWPQIGSGISWSAIRLFFELSPAAGAMVFFDAPAGGVPAGPIIVDESQPRSRMIAMAGGSRDSICWDPLSGISTFVRCISAGLETGAADVDDDGEATGSELAEFLVAEVPHQSGYLQRTIARSFLPQTAEFHFKKPVEPASRGSGTLVLRGAPIGAVVAVDGRRTTGIDTLALRSGTHRVAVYGQAGIMEAEVRIARDSAALVDVRLQTLPGYLDVHCFAESATVRLDGEVLGTTPISRAMIPCGVHELVLQKKGFIDDSSRIFIRPGSPARIHRWLRKYYALGVTSDPPGASVKVDEMLVGSTPLLLDGIAEGERYLELAAPDFHPFRVVVQGYWSDTVRIAKKLTSMYGVVRLRSSSASATASLDSRLIPSPLPDSCRILTGTHSLSISDPSSGAAVEGSFLLGPTEHLDAIAEFEYFSLPRCIRGVLIPGLNQIGDKMVLPGIGMLLANAGSLVFALTAQSSLQDRRGTYESARTDYLAATNERDAIRTRTAMSAAYDDLDRATRSRNIAASCFAGAFVLSAVHTIFFHSRESSLEIFPSRSIALKPTVDIGTERLRYGIAISF